MGFQRVGFRVALFVGIDEDESVLRVAAFVAPGCVSPVLDCRGREGCVGGICVVCADNARGVDGGAGGVGDWGGVEEGYRGLWVTVGEGEGG